MAVKRFGPTLAPGVAIIEQEAEKLIEPAPLGVTLYIGPLERGEIGELISTTSKSDMLAKVGGLISESDLPDCAQDFWDNSRGAGELHLVRVASTDGADLRTAEIDLYSREMTDPTDNFAGGKARAVVRVKAKNGGRWGSRKRTVWGEVAVIGTDITATTLDTANTMKQDEWKDGYVVLDGGIAGREYRIIGNTAAGVITVSSDANMSADLAAGTDPTDPGYTLRLDTRVDAKLLKRNVQVQVGDGDQKPDSQFSLDVYVNESLVKRYPDLSMDPTDKDYFVGIINDDTSNYFIEVADLLSPADPAPADRRPANDSGIVSGITPTTMTSKIFQARRTAGTANPSFALGATTDAHKYRDILEFEVTADGATATLTMKSMRVGGGTKCHADVTASNTNTTPFAFTSPTSPHAPPITITCGTTVFTVGDKFQVDYFPYETDELKGGWLVPDHVNSPTTLFKITSNDHKTITVQTGDLITDGGGAGGDRFMVFFKQELGGPDRVGAVATNGYDALATLADSDYTDTALNISTSPALSLKGQNKGLVKVATPDRTSTTVAKQGLQFAEALNWQYRVEIPDNITDENSAITHINSTIGRNDHGVTIFPSFAHVNDPEKDGQLKLIPVTGMVHGREALVAKNYDGYHKAAAGEDVVLSRIAKLPFQKTLNEELLNPKGVNIIKKKRGNFIIWGDRTIAVDAAWKWKHQRELMSHYEKRLEENFDFVIFALNDPRTQRILISSLQSMFLPEFQKGAVRGTKFEEAVQIKIDDENNTAATRAAGDLFADLTLQLADTVERFVIRVGKAGIFDDTST